MIETDIIIAGGGLAGPVMAVALAQEGWDVTLVGPETPPVPRAYALAQASVRLLNNLGLWDSLADSAQPMAEIKVTQGRTGEGPTPGWLLFQSDELGTGPMGHMIEDAPLRKALTKGLSAVRVINGEVTGQTMAPGHIRVETTQGPFTARLLIGADGASSGTARRAGIRHMGWDYDQTGLTAVIEHQKPHGGVAHQLFLPGGPLAILPITGNRSSIVWTTRRAQAATLHALPDDAFLDALRPVFGSFLGDIALGSKRGAFPLRLSIAQPPVADRVALIGDAAHQVHPLAGQGLNAGLKDIAALHHVLTEARSIGEDIGNGQVLDRYTSWRRFDVATLAAATDSLYRLFSNDNPLLRGLRGAGLTALSNLPALRSKVIREAAGIEGVLPNLMR